MKLFATRETHGEEYSDEEEGDDQRRSTCGEGRIVSGIGLKQRVPVEIEHLHERLDYIRVELCTGIRSEFILDSPKRQGLTIRPIGHHGIEGVDDRKDLRFQGYLVSPQAVRVPVSVIPLMVLDDCLSYAFQRLDRSQDIVADERMSLNQAVFLGCELALFLKNEVVNPYLPDVVENGRMFEELDRYLSAVGSATC